LTSYLGAAAHQARSPPGLKKVNPNKQPNSLKSAPPPGPRAGSSTNPPTAKSTPSTSSVPRTNLEMDMDGMGLEDENDTEDLPPPKITLAREKILEEARLELDKGGADGKRALSLVVVGW